MTAIAHPASLALLAAAVLAAAWCDMRRLTIPNRIPLVIAGLYPLFVLVGPGPVDALGGLGVAAAILVGGFCLFAAGLMGAGDVKLLSAVGLWAGRDHGSELVLLTTLIGGVLAAALLTPWGNALLARIQTTDTARTVDGGRDGRVARRPMPYGVAITLATLILIGQL